MNSGSLDQYPSNRIITQADLDQFGRDLEKRIEKKLKQERGLLKADEAKQQRVPSVIIAVMLLAALVPLLEGTPFAPRGPMFVLAVGLLLVAIARGAI
jgi:hypothetical protein